jgi:hypothetical protein
MFSLLPFNVKGIYSKFQIEKSITRLNEIRLIEKPLRSNVPVRLTADEFEIASDAPNLTVPADMVVAPVYELPAPFNVNAPDPNLVRLIAPEIAPPILFKRLFELIVNAPFATVPAI